MNTIEIEGKTYEVLTLGKHGDMTHVLFAGGSLVEGESCTSPEKGFWAYNDDPYGRSYSLEMAKLHNIQPLQLVPNEPVSFEVTCAKNTLGQWMMVHCLDDALAYQNNEQRKFRCVEIVEEEAQAILKAKGVE